MQSNPKFPAQFSADLVKFTEEIINRKLYFLCSDYSYSTRIGVDVKRRYVWSCTNLILIYVLFLAPIFFFFFFFFLRNKNFGKFRKIPQNQSTAESTFGKIESLKKKLDTFVFQRFFQISRSDIFKNTSVSLFFLSQIVRFGIFELQNWAAKSSYTKWIRT